MNQTNETPSILTSLRAFIPTRDCDFDEALTVAERQAARLVERLKATDRQFDGIELHHIAGLPRIRVVYDQLPVSGMSYWNGHEWIIAIAKTDSLPRQRFTLLHEFKHIIDHGACDRLYQDTKNRTEAAQAEQAADYFAGCALVPKTALKRAWAAGIQRPAALADYFSVSEQAIRVRLDQTGIARERDPEPEAEQPTRRERCARPISTPIHQPQRFTVRRPMYAWRSYA